MIVIEYNEFTFSLNKFNTPKIIKNKDAIYTLIVRLLLLEPGTIQSHPDMGVGIVSRYRYSFEGAAAQLKRDIDKQISQFLPELQGCEIVVNDSGGNLSIQIIADDTMYDFTFDTTSGTLAQLVNM